MLKGISTILATWFYSGYLRPASGTWGTIAALPLCYVSLIFLNQVQFMFLVGILFALGTLATDQYIRIHKKDDPSEVVIDEVVGMMIAVLPLIITFRWDLFIIGFVLFRLFDAVKRGPVGWLDGNIKGALGVMIDDVAAGLMSAICVLGVLLWMN